MELIERMRGWVKSVMRIIARGLDRMTGGKITPNQITATGLVAHVPIAILIARGQLVLAGVLLIIFGLFDTLDGEVARLQKSATPFGMFIDSSSDRIKEVLLYCGIVAALLRVDSSSLVVVAAVGALGASLCTSYLNAWGEAVLATIDGNQAHKVNKTFRSGLLGFDLRIIIIILGLVINRLDWAVIVILVLATLTVLQRYAHIAGRLKSV